ncbi:unnamed protein product [Boreogadus saida]
MFHTFTPLKIFYLGKGGGGLFCSNLALNEGCQPLQKWSDRRFLSAGWGCSHFSTNWKIQQTLPTKVTKEAENNQS